MKEKYEHELAEYKSYSEDIKETLETNYQLAMLNNDIERAYNVVGDLMSFKLIDATDPRIQKNNKMFQAGGVEKDHRFRLDYRKDAGFIPEWIFGKIDPVRKVQLKTVTHWGKRVEGNYEGDTVFNSHDMHLRISQCSTPRQVENEMESVEKLFKKLGTLKKLTDMTTMAKHGVYRVFNMEFDGPCVNGYKYVGTIIVRMREDGVECTLVINYESLEYNWVKIQNAINGIKEAFNKMANQECKFRLAIDSKGAIESQNGLIASKGDASVKPK